MLKANKKITLSGEELIEALKEIELILISLHKMGSYYGEKFIESEDKYRAEYEIETTRFIDDWKVTRRLAKVRRILSEKFDDTLDEDDMDDLERAMDGIKYWVNPGDNPDDSIE
jgi:hypothetical protein